ncbi:glycosyltransferase family 2 protein [Spirosoma aerophilum]
MNETTSYTPISAYVLTYNSDRYLDQLLTQLTKMADDIVIIDSGSKDQTEAIARKHGSRFVYRALDDFRAQRNFALQCCKHRMVLSLDSDEIPNDDFIEVINQMKVKGFDVEAYRIERHWIVMGKKIRALYPTKTPDFPIRLINRDIVSFDENSYLVHEAPFGYSSVGHLPGSINHYTFETSTEINRKLEQYTSIAATDAVVKYGKITWIHRFVHPPIVWAKWYLLNGGWRDGKVGWSLGRYAFLYTLFKFQKATKLPLKS